MGLFKNIITRAMHRQLSRLDSLYQRHAGEECYIFGNGVSLKWMDLHQFSNKMSIVGNFGIYHKEASALKIPYYTIIQPYFSWPYSIDDNRLLRLSKNNLYKEFCKSIVQNPKTLFFLNFSCYPIAKFDNVVFVSRYYKPPFELRNPFKDRDDSHIGTLRFQISLAIFLGFKKAYLVGHDYTHFPSRAAHFYEKGSGKSCANKDFCAEFINYAKPSIELVTVTLDSVSETMDYVTYKALTGKEPRFRENIEILDRDKLENLDNSNRNYEIF